mmetsp:Transcript_34438/g.87076  ORF Transcript_34438/g.87076 Transcript_34438/m.87076 type:complete len:203 (+) Transcript_34438:1176-1784(+)
MCLPRPCLRCLGARHSGRVALLSAASLHLEQLVLTSTAGLGTDASRDLCAVVQDEPIAESMHHDADIRLLAARGPEDVFHRCGAAQEVHAWLALRRRNQRAARELCASVERCRLLRKEPCAMVGPRLPEVVVLPQLARPTTHLAGDGLELWQTPAASPSGWGAASRGRLARDEGGLASVRRGVQRLEVGDRGLRKKGSRHVF